MATDDAANPYQPPAHDPAGKASIHPPERTRAMTAIKCALFVLAPAALANWACIQFLDISKSGLGPGSFYGTDRDTQFIFGGINLAAILLAFGLALIWLLPLIELAGGGLWFCFGRRTRRREWMIALYRSLRKLIIASCLGSATWLLWLLVFFGMGNQSSLATTVFAIAGHSCGALVYVTMILNWIALPRADTKSNRQSVGP